jgi:hypothetical protein
VKGVPILDDIGYKFLPLAPFTAPDLYFLAWVPYGLLRLVIMQRNGVAIFIRIMFVYGVCLILRALMLNLTVLPDPNPRTNELQRQLT